MSVPYQVPINGTYQKRIPPGNQTNLYYILLSNLPWQTSWQQLKDHVRVVCPVERVEVFNESTTGWVSVRGRDNFDAAFDLLNGGIFNGRPLFADGKNATESVMIKEPVDVQGAHQQTPKSSRTATRSSNPPPLHYHDSLVASAVPFDKWAHGSLSSTAVLPQAADYQLYSGMNGQVYDYRDTPRYKPSFAERQASKQETAYDWPGTAPAYRSHSYPSDYATRHFRPETCSKPSRPLTHHIRAQESICPMAGFPAVDHDKTHKIVIRHIAPHITHQQFEDMMRNKMGHNVDDFAEVELPISDTHDSNRGFAIAHFFTESAASRAARKLQGTIYANRALKVELSRRSPAKDSTIRSARPRKACKDDKERRDEKETSDASGSSKKPRYSQKSDVIIANGSSSKSTSYRI